MKKIFKLAWCRPSLLSTSRDLGSLDVKGLREILMSVSGPGVVMAMGGVGELLLTCKNQLSILYTCTAPSHREPLVGGGGRVQQRRGALPRAAPPAKPKTVYCTRVLYLTCSGLWSHYTWASGDSFSLGSGKI